MIKQGLNIRLGQSLTMTPQLQQAIRLLQLSTVELEQEIQETLDSNPLLEISTEQLDNLENTANSNKENNKNSDTTESDIPNDMDIDANWEDIYADYSNPVSNNDASVTSVLEKTYTSSDSLQAHLRWQIELSQLSDTDKIIAETIIDAINDKGYLSTTTESIYDFLKDELLLEDYDEIESILSYIQHLDPIGSGARNLGECLAIQLKEKSPNTPLAIKSAKLIKQRPNLLEPKQHAILKKELKLTPAKFSELLQLIKTLAPHPGSSFENNTTEYITPDVYVRKIAGIWQVSLNANISPNLQINDFYADLLMKQGKSSDIKYLKSNLQQANWFIKSIHSRNQTILKVAKLIVDHQKAFLQYGDQAMRPMILRDIAEQLDMHESSISRATTRKYIHTPRGIFELKYFFSSQLSTETGGVCSSTAIQSIIKQLIDNEDLKKPLSDNKLTMLLKEQGIKVARRTVAKYRESINIPSSHDRKAIV